MAIILPVLLIIFFTLVDLYFVTWSYIGVNQIVREAIMTGATIQNMEGGCKAAGTGEDSGCAVVALTGPPVNGCAPDGTSHCGHYFMLWRVNQLREVARFKGTELPLVQTTFSSSARIIETKVRVSFSGISPYFRNFNFIVKARGASRMP